MLPLYGQYPFQGIEPLCNQLHELSSDWLGGGEFSAYVVLEGDQKHYGLTLDELIDTGHRWHGRIRSFTVVSSGLGGRVVRISVQYFPAPTTLQIRYLIATGQTDLNYAIRKVLTGESGRLVDHPRPSRPMAEILAPALRTRDAVFTPMRRFFQKPTFSINDHFHFDPSVSADGIIDLVNYISERYLNEAVFHLRLETVDGDFHLHLDRRELRYLFERQGEKRLMLYLDSADRQEQWFSLRLSYHPLATGPNAEVNLISPQAEQIQEALKEALEIEASPSRLPDILQRQYTHTQPQLDTILQTVRLVADSLLDRAPTVGLVQWQNGEVLRGLSPYQLRQRVPQNLEKISELVVFIGRISTGQACILWWRKSGDSWQMNASMMWGNIDLAGLTLDELSQGMGLLEQPSPPATATTVESYFCLMPAIAQEEGRSALWESALEQMGFPSQVLSLQQAHREWEEMVRGILKHEGIVIDLTYQDPRLIMWAKAAAIMGKSVVITIEENRPVPEEFESWPQVAYSLTRDKVSDLVWKWQNSSIAGGRS